MKGRSLLLQTESHSSACAATAALGLLGFLSTHPHFTHTCRHRQPPDPTRGSLTLCDGTRRPQGQHSDRGSGLPSRDQCGATSVTVTLSKWGEAREDLRHPRGSAEGAGGEAGRAGFAQGGEGI